MNLIHNEQTKLRATFLNNTAVGLMIGGFVLPYIAFFSTTDLVSFKTAMIVSIISLLVMWAAAVAVHTLALIQLRKLREE
jgi:hypothetical protein